MKKVILLYFIFIGLSVSAQKDPCRLITKANQEFCNQNFKKSAKNLKKFLKKFPEHSLNEEGRYALGLSYFHSGKLERAVKVFEMCLVDSSYKDDFDQDIFDCQFMINKCRNILIPDQNAIIRHEASIKIAEIHLMGMELEKALEYIALADTFYRVYSNCGTGDLDEDIRMAVLYSRYFEKMDMIDSAVKVMLPYTLKPAAYPMRYYYDLLNRTVQLLQKYYQRKSILSSFDEAIENVYYEEHPALHGKYGKTYYIYYFNVPVQAAPAYLFEHSGTREDVIKFIKETEFYRKLKEI